MKQETVKGNTPHGGKYAIAYYRDRRGNPTDKSKAAHVEIVEYDANDKQIWRVYGSISKRQTDHEVL